MVPNTGQLAHRRAGGSSNSKVAPQLPGATEGPAAAATRTASSASPQRRFAKEKAAVTGATAAGAPFAATNRSIFVATMRREEAAVAPSRGVAVASPYGAASNEVLTWSSTVMHTTKV